MLKAEVSEQVNALNLQIEKFTEDKKHFYNELAYKFGMHLYLSGNVCAPDSVSKPMLWVYALDAGIKFVQEMSLPRSVVIHEAGGKIREERTYPRSMDPARYKG